MSIKYQMKVTVWGLIRCEWSFFNENDTHFRLSFSGVTITCVLIALNETYQELLSTLPYFNADKTLRCIRCSPPHTPLYTVSENINKLSLVEINPVLFVSCWQWNTVNKITPQLLSNGIKIILLRRFHSLNCWNRALVADSLLREQMRLMSISKRILMCRCQWR